MSAVLKFEEVNDEHQLASPSNELMATGPVRAIWVNAAQWESLKAQLRGQSAPVPKAEPAELTLDEFAQELLTADGKIHLSIDISPMATACHRASKEITGLLAERARLYRGMKRLGVDVDKLIVSETVLEDLEALKLEPEG